MIDWFGRDAARRMTALEQDIAALSRTVANPPPAEDPRVERIASTLTALEYRLAALEDRAAARDAQLAEQAAADLARDEHAEAAREETARLRGALARLERQFSSYAEETSKIAAGLLERIERGRAPRGPAPPVTDQRE